MQEFKLFLSSDEDRVLKIAMSGELDLLTVGQLRDAFTSAVGGGEYQQLVVDLGQLTFIDSSGMHALVDADRAMRGAGGSLQVINVAPNLLKLFAVMGLDRVLMVRDTQMLSAA